MTDVIIGGSKQKKQVAVTSRFHMTLAKRKIMWAYIFLAIPIIFFLYIRIYPTFFAFRMSLYDWNPLAAEQTYLGLENYRTLFTDITTPQSVTQSAFANTAKYVALGMPIQLVLALLVALMLNEIRFMATIYRVMFFLPFVTSTIAISWVFRWLYQPRIGLFNVLLEAFSLPQQPFLRSTDQALYSIMAVVIWQGLGFAVVIFFAGIKQVPRVFYEAAKVDGASRWQSFWKITLPLLNPVIVYLVVLQSIGFLRMFAEVLAMSPQGDGGPLNSTTTVVLRVYREAFQRLNMGYASTLTVILFVIILSITVIQLRVLRRNIEY
jgi:multiple sugar transport system permease protein